MAPQSDETDWPAIIGRSLAYVALHKAELGDADLGAKAMFLEGLGLPRADVARMLGTTTGSVKTLLQRKKGRRRGKK